MSRLKNLLSDIQIFPSRDAFPYFEMDNPELLEVGDIVSDLGFSVSPGETVLVFALKQWEHFYDACVPRDLHFVELRCLQNNDYKVVKLLDNERFVDYFMERNRFTILSDHLQNIGISEQLLNGIKPHESFFGMIEVCTCGFEACRSRFAWIVMHEDNTFSIPFTYSYTNRTIEPFIERVNPLVNIQDELMVHHIRYDNRGYVTSFFSASKNREEAYPFPAFCSGYISSLFDFIPERNNPTYE